jgi:hypothetical protein
LLPNSGKLIIPQPVQIVCVLSRREVLEGQIADFGQRLLGRDVVDFLGLGASVILVLKTL